MFDSWITLTVTIAAISAGLMAGVYFAFSGFIMRSFDRLGNAQATEAMNAVNDVILRSWFMVLFFGSTVLFLILSAVALFSTELAGRWLLFSTAMIYVIGMFLCTVMFNVPLNERLAAAQHDDSKKAEVWALYFKEWTRWNHLRSVSSLAGLTFSLVYLVSYR